MELAISEKRSLQRPLIRSFYPTDARGPCRSLESLANRFIIVADYRKNSEYLGANVSFPTSAHSIDDRWLTVRVQWKAGVPVEVAPFAYAKVLQNLVLLGSQNPTLRMGKAKAGPVVSDNGNFIIDAPFSTEDLKDPLRVSLLPLALHPDWDP